MLGVPTNKVPITLAPTRSSASTESTKSLSVLRPDRTTMITWSTTGNRSSESLEAFNGLVSMITVAFCEAAWLTSCLVAAISSLTSRGSSRQR